jgi:hypothetical protein
MKRALAERPASDVDADSVDKMPWIAAGLGRADAWAARTGWTVDPGPVARADGSPPGAATWAGDGAVRRRPTGLRSIHPDGPAELL